jgi:hypothetical protein
MNIGDFLFELFEYFAGKYADAVKDRVRKLADALSDAERKAVFDHLIENQKASFKISVAELVESCRFLGIGYHAAHYTPAVDWYCDACGHNFKYAQAANDDEKIDLGLHDVCPMCGFQPGWTMVRDAYARIGHLSKDYVEEYQKRAKECASKHGDSPNCGRGPGGPYFARAKAEQERRDSAKKPVQPEWTRPPKAT